MKLENSYAVLNDKPGIYKWWVIEEQLSHFERIHGLKKSEDYEIKVCDGKNLYCIYVGKASGPSLKDRLKLYVSKSFGVSTIRKDIGKIPEKGENSQEVNDYIDNLYVTCEVYDMGIGNYRTDILCKILETYEINKKYRICNTSENYNK